MRLCAIGNLMLTLQTKFIKKVKNKTVKIFKYLLLRKKWGGMILFFCLISCLEEKIEIYPKRNILFYIGADDDLINRDTSDKINKIRLGWQPDKGEMLIYADRKSEGASLLRVNNTLDVNGYYGLDTLEVYGSENSADAATLRRVINKIVADYPADSYGMIFFSHASGWLPEGMLNRPLSMVIDGEASTDREMEYYDFASAIPNRQFDFIILEACLMSDVLSMYELREKADYVLASSAEIVSPGFYTVYADEIMRLYETKEDIPSVVSGFAQSYFNKIAALPENDVLCSATLSLIKMNEMENLASATKAVLQGISIDETTVPLDEVQSFDRPKELIKNGSVNSRYFDFAHTIEQIASELHYKAFNEQLEKTVVWKAATKRFLLEDRDVGVPDFTYDGFFIERHSGLTTYILQDVYPYLNSKFKASSWYKAIYSE
jgi:hypothetical protein